jgi:hypothetical protein
MKRAGYECPKNHLANRANLRRNDVPLWSEHPNTGTATSGPRKTGAARRSGQTEPKPPLLKARQSI